MWLQRKCNFHFETPKAAFMTSVLRWYKLARSYDRFGEPCCLCLQGLILHAEGQRK